MEVAVADDGDAAAHMYMSGSDSYDAILMDCQMPHVNGCQAACVIRAFEKDKDQSEKRVPIIGLTAYEHHKELCLLAGMDSFLVKPVAKTVLVSTLASIMRANNVSPPRKLPSVTKQSSVRNSEPTQYIPQDQSLPTLTHFLQSNALDSLQPVFEEAEINSFELLLYMGKSAGVLEADLKEMGVPVGKRRKLGNLLSRYL